MLNLKRNVTSLLVAALLCFSLAGLSYAGTKDYKNINNISCKDVMRYSGADRDISIGVIHGYLLGEKGTGKFKLERLTRATDEFIETCLDNPKAKAVKTMSAILKKTE